MTPTGAESPQVVVIGGGGFYGRYLVADLLQFTEARVLISSRNPPALPEEPRVITAVCDLEDYDRLQEVVAGNDVVVHCAGPFQYLPLNPLLAAIEAGVNYVDIAEDRRFARRVASLAPRIESSGITALSGISVVPAMEALFVQLIRPQFQQVKSVRTFAAPDTRKHRGHAMFHTMLIGVGRQYYQPRNGKRVPVFGWSQPEWIEFPPPIGRRLTYLVLEMADLDVLPDLFGVETVEFKAGSEHAFLNRLLGLAATIRAKTGRPNWQHFTPALRLVSRLVGVFGKDEGGVIFEITGIYNDEVRTYRFAVNAKNDGGRIPVVLAGIVVEQILKGDLSQPGLLPIHDWVSPPRLLEQLRARDLDLWWQAPGHKQWQPFGVAELQHDR